MGVFKALVMEGLQYLAMAHVDGMGWVEAFPGVSSTQSWSWRYSSSGFLFLSFVFGNGEIEQDHMGNQ